MHHYYEDFRNILFNPKIFFKENINCKFHKSLLYFFIFSLCQGIFNIIIILTKNFNLFLSNPIQYIIQPIIINSASVVILGGVISVLFFIFFRFNNYKKILEVLFFIQMKWLVFIIISGVLANFIFDYHYGHLKILLYLWYLFQIVGLIWIFQTILVGIMIFTNISLKKSIIPIIIPFIVLSLIYFWNIGFFTYFIQLTQTNQV